MMQMKRRWSSFCWIVTVVLVLAASLSLAAKPKMAKLSKKLLYGDAATRLEAIKAFNKLPVDKQFDLVPDFMVALSDDNLEVRKIASRILRAMGVDSAAQIPDAKKGVQTAPAPSPTEAKEQLADEKKQQDATMPDVQKEISAPQGLPVTPPVPVHPAGEDKWADLKQIRGDESGDFSDMKKELEREKKGQIALDPAALESDSGAATTPLAIVVESLKDPTPWVRAQAARRLAMIHPAPIDTIPTLIAMLNDKDVECRIAAAAALGSFGSQAREAIPALNKSLNDPDDKVSLIAADALKQIQQP